MEPTPPTTPEVPTYEGFVLQVLHTYNKQKDRPDSKRYGQIAYTELRLARPDLAAEVAATSKDPYGNDKNLDQFWDFVNAKW